MTTRERRRRKGRKITIRHADGRTEVVRPGHFKKRRQKRKRTAYANYLRSTHWKRIRKQALIRDKHRCVRCGSSEHLQVHHMTYERLNAERLSDLTTLCRSCHKMHHVR